MTVRVTKALVLMALGLLMAVPGEAKPPPPSCHTNGQAALQAMTQGNFDQVVEYFAPGLARVASPDRLRTAWTQLGASFGAFRELGGLQPRTIAGKTVLVASLTFSNGGLDGLVACDAKNQITEFRFVPAAALAVESKGERSVSASGAASAVAQLLASSQVHSRGPHEMVVAHVSRSGVRIVPMSVSSPLGPLPAALTLPAGTGPFPAVVLVQGSGSHDLDETVGPNKPFRDLAEGLAKAGIASLRYDKRVYVYRDEVAENSNLTVDDEVTVDALTALHLLAKHEAIDPRRVFVLGHSEGAVLVPRILSRDSQLAGGIMLAASARPLLDVMIEQTREVLPAGGNSQAQVQTIVDALSAEKALLAKADAKHPPTGRFSGAPQSWWVSMHKYHQVAVAKSLARPLLILQGESDFQVSPSKDFGAWKRALANNANMTFRLYPGLSHLFMPAGKTRTVADYLDPANVDAAVVTDIASWINRQSANGR